MNLSWQTSSLTKTSPVQPLSHPTPASASKTKSASLQAHSVPAKLIIGAIPGQETVSGARWLELSYGYSADHIWRNLGIIIAFFIFFTFTFLAAVEYSSPPDSRGEVLVFQKGKEPDHLHDSEPHTDEEAGQAERITSPDEAAMATRRATLASVQEMKKELHTTKDVFTWRNVCCDVLIKGEPRRLLSNVFGYVKPGTLTALMGESGAGKTTLLDTYVPFVRC